MDVITAVIIAEGDYPMKKTTTKNASQVAAEKITKSGKTKATSPKKASVAKSASTATPAAEPAAPAIADPQANVTPEAIVDSGVPGTSGELTPVEPVASVGEQVAQV